MKPEQGGMIAPQPHFQPNKVTKFITNRIQRRARLGIAFVVRALFPDGKIIGDAHDFWQVVQP